MGDPRGLGNGNFSRRSAAAPHSAQHGEHTGKSSTSDSHGQHLAPQKLITATDVDLRMATSVMTYRALRVFLVALALFLPGNAWASPGSLSPGDGSPEAAEPSINGGQECSTCQFPSVVALANQGLCTGTLVHPRVVLYAAHCGAGFDEIYFGESAFSPRFSVPVASCQLRVNAAEVGPLDYAFCVLAEPVERVPVTPVLFGCEGEELTTGRNVTIVGFGENEQGQAGVKRWANTVVAGFAAGMVMVGSSTTNADFGDSGGPALIELADGSWRAFGIVSGGRDNEPVYYVDMREVVPWVEQNSGIDITPCHDSDGTWRPNTACGSFATNPELGGDWFDYCSTNDPLSAPSTTCGPSFIPDEDPPTIAIVSPEDGHVFEDTPSEVSIEIGVEDANPIRIVRLAVDGEVVQEKREAPWVFAGTFPEGTYDLAAQAEDLSGNSAVSEQVVMYVGEDPGGCFCQAGTPPVGSPLLFLATALGFVALTRRRRS